MRRGAMMADTLWRWWFHLEYTHNFSKKQDATLHQNCIGIFGEAWNKIILASILLHVIIYLNCYGEVICHKDDREKDCQSWREHKYLHGRLSVLHASGKCLASYTTYKIFKSFHMNQSPSPTVNLFANSVFYKESVNCWHTCEQWCMQ